MKELALVSNGQWEMGRDFQANEVLEIRLGETWFQPKPNTLRKMEDGRFTFDHGDNQRMICDKGAIQAVRVAEREAAQ